MTFDEQGRIVWTPKNLFALALANPRRLISGLLMAGHTPAAFPDHERYCDFLDAIWERTGVGWKPETPKRRFSFSSTQQNCNLKMRTIAPSSFTPGISSIPMHE
jgi:hypothetical protein